MDSPVTSTTLQWLAGIGAAIGLGQLLVAGDPITWRLALGRAICSAGLATGGAAALIWIPTMPMPAVLGLGAALASLGTSGLERLLQKYIPK